MNSFGTLFHDKIFSPTIPWLLTNSNIPDISRTCSKFADISRFSRQVVTLRTLLAEYGQIDSLPYLVSSFHANPLRYRPVLLLLPTEFAFDDERLVSRLQKHSAVCTPARRVNRILAYSPLCRFAPWLIRPRTVVDSPPVNNRTNVYLSSTRTNNKYFYHYVIAY